MANTDALRTPVIARPGADASIEPRLKRIWETAPGFVGALCSVDH